MTKNRGYWMCNWLRRLGNRAFESETVPEDQKNVMVVLLYKEKGEKGEWYYQAIKALLC